MRYHIKSNQIDSNMIVVSGKSIVVYKNENNDTNSIWVYRNKTKFNRNNMNSDSSIVIVVIIWIVVM